MRRALLLAVLATLGLATTAVAQTKIRSTPSLERSKALAAAPTGSLFELAPAIPAATARVIADDLAAAIPLPAGGTFSGVRWEEAGGLFSRAEITGVLQYNAACQWLRAWRDGRDKATAGQVLGYAPTWSAWRFADGADALARVAADVRAGGGQAATAMVRDCDAAHERETAYAAARGLPPSR
jgi:hypothetical protein